MRRFAVLTVAVIACLAGSVSAGAAEWKPGTPYFIPEYQMEDALKKNVDFASCFGIQRYGTHGMNTRRYGWQKGYTRFKCSYEIDETSCYDLQIKVVKAKKRNWWTSRYVRDPHCY